MRVKTKHSIPRRYVSLPLRSLFISCLGAELHVPMLAPLPWKLLIYKTGFNYPLDKSLIALDAYKGTAGKTVNHGLQRGI